MQWPVPATHMWLQRFQGFTNFYRQFILNCSRLATPLTLLNSFFYFCLVPCFHFSAVEQPVHHHTVYFRFWVCPNQLFPGGKTKHTTWNPGPQHISIIHIHPGSSWWRWMPLTLGPALLYPKGLWRIENYTLCFFSLAVSPQQREIMMLAIVNFGCGFADPGPLEICSSP